VVGNDSYQYVGSLRNARADARAIASGLEATGFRVTLRTDLDEKAMKEALRTFKSQIRGGDVAVFYYSGHGVQLGGSNLLLPVDIHSESEDQVQDEAIPLQRVLDDLQEQKARFSLAIVDACRNNPFKGLGRAIGGRGLAPTSAATGQMVLYSAGAGQEALDTLGSGDKNPNGLFTRVLIKEIRKPGIPAERVLRNVREEVVRLAKGVGHEQVPAIYDQALGEFYFVPGAAAAPNPAGAGTAVIPGETPPPPQATVMVGYLQVMVNAPKAKVFVDGELKGEAGPMASLNIQDLPVGEVMVKVEAPGYEPRTESLQVDEGKWTQAKVVLARKAAELPVPAAAYPVAPGPQASAGQKSLDVGIVLPSKDEPRWIQDEIRFQALRAAGYRIEVLFSQGDTAREKANVEALVAKGAKVIIMCPQDGAAAAAAADEAHLDGVKVIAYDRLIRDTPNVDCYVTFDSVQVGAAMGEYLCGKATGRGNNLYLYAGAPSDNNAFLFFEGAWNVLQPRLADGTFVVQNSSEAAALVKKAKLTREEEARIIRQITTNWNFNDARSLAATNLGAADRTAKGRTFICAPNDGTARAIADVFATDRDVSSFCITGQDAERASVQYIIDGRQSMTVLKDVRSLVADAIGAATAFLKGGQPDRTRLYFNGKAAIPSRPTPLVSVTRDNLKSAIIDSGYYRASNFTNLR
jgi:putative multiple sugar transport system substrate-binding protein